MQKFQGIAHNPYHLEKLWIKNFIIEVFWSLSKTIYLAAYIIYYYSLDIWKQDNLFKGSQALKAQPLIFENHIGYLIALWHYVITLAELTPVSIRLLEETYGTFKLGHLKTI